MNTFLINGTGGDIMRLNNKIISISLVLLIGIGVICGVLWKRRTSVFLGYLYPICENGLYGYIDSVGNKIIEPQYLWCSTFSEGRALVVVDTIFKEVDDSVAYWAGETDYVRKKYRMFAKYGFIDKSGDYVLNPDYLCFVTLEKESRDNLDMESCGEIFNELKFFSGRAKVYDTLTWKVGYMDKEGNVVIPQRYYYANPFSDSLAVVYEKVFSTPYRQNFSYFRTLRCLRMGYIDVEGNAVTECKFEELTPMTAKRGVGKYTVWGGKSEEGEGRSFMTYNVLFNEKGDSLANLSFIDKYYRYSTDGISVTESVLFSEEEIIDGEEHSSYSYIDKNGDYLEPLKGLSKAKIASLSDRKDIMGVYADDTPIMRRVTYFEDGLAGASPDGEHWFIIDRYFLLHGYGEESIFEGVGGFNNGLCAVKKNGKWGYIDTKVNEVIPCKYDYCRTAYPYLEEAFDIDEDDNFQKKYWINRFDSIVWTYDYQAKVSNKYSDKPKTEWGNWRSYSVLEVLSMYQYTIIIVICALLMVVAIVLIVTKQKTKYIDLKLNVKRKNTTIIIAIVTIIISIVSGHYIMYYLLSDYCNISEETIKKDSDNFKRKRNIARKGVWYGKEHFFAKDSIGVKPKNTKWLRQGIGVLPKGEYISTYVGTGHDSYFAGYEEVTRYRLKQVPRYKTVDYGWGIRDRYQDGWDYVDEPYKDYDPVYYDYNWMYALSSFDISDRLSLFVNEDSVYSEYLYELECQLKANYGYKYIYTDVKGKKALRYTAYDGEPIKRIIFCANGRAYIMETKSIDKLNEHSEEACAKIYFEDFDLVSTDNVYIIVSMIVFVISLFLLLYIFIWYNKGTMILNRAAHRCLLFAIGSVILNVMIIGVIVYFMYVEFYVSEWLSYTLVLAILSSVLVSPSLIYYYSKCEKQTYSLDYIIPDWMNSMIYSKIRQNVNRKLFLTFVAYPFMVISLIPIGIVIMVYAVPAVIVSFLMIHVFRWVTWLKQPNDSVEH